MYLCKTPVCINVIHCTCNTPVCIYAIHVIPRYICSMDNARRNTGAECRCT